MIEDLIEKKEIIPKNIIQMDETILKELKEIFKEFKCSKCLDNLTINIDRKKEDSILYVIINCKNNHKDIKKLSSFLTENKFAIEKDFIFYDLVPSDIGEEENDQNEIILEFLVDEYYLICFTCKKIYHSKKRFLGQIDHKHFLFEYDIFNNEIFKKAKKEEHFFLNKNIDYLSKN